MRLYISVSQSIALVGSVASLALAGCSKNVDFTTLNETTRAAQAPDGETSISIDSANPILISSKSATSSVPLYYRCQAAIIDSNIGVDQTHLLNPENEETVKLDKVATDADRVTQDGHELVSHSGYEIDLIRIDSDNVQLALKRVQTESSAAPILFLSETTSAASSASLQSEYQNADNSVHLTAKCRRATSDEIKDYEADAK